MRVLWISCLLIGSITCGPVGKKFSANNADPSSMIRPPFFYGYGYSGMGVSSDSGSSFPQPSLSNPSSDGNAFYGGYASSGDERYGYDNSAPSGGYGGSASWSSGSANSYDGGDENSEPVFSDVSDLEPVYSFSSRSSYQRGRAVFAQTRYSPEEPVPQIMPVSRRMSKTSKPHSPAKAPTKGGF